MSITRVSAFLKERKDRFDPDKANASGLKRVRKIDFSGTVHLDDEVLTRTKMILVKHGDLLISGINAEKGAVSVYAGNEDVLATIHYSSYEYDSKKIDVEYLKYLLMSPVFKRILKGHSKSGIKTELKPKKFLSLELPLPDVKDQKACVNYLHRLINKIDLLNNQIASNGEVVRKLRKAILQEAVQGRLVEQDPNDETATELLKKIKMEKERLIKERKIKMKKSLPLITDVEMSYELPKGWVWVRFRDITQVITCGLASTPEYVETGRIFLSAKNVKPYKFQPEDHKCVSQEVYEKITKNAKPEKGDMLLTRVGAGIGEAAIVDRDIDFAYYVSLTLVKPIKQYLCSEYLLHWLSSPEGIDRALHNTYGKGVSQGNLNVNQVRQYILPLPPLKEQNRIAKKVNKLIKYCDELEAKINQSKAGSEKLMQTVLQEAFES